MVVHALVEINKTMGTGLHDEVVGLPYQWSYVTGSTSSPGTYFALTSLPITHIYGKTITMVPIDSL